MCAHYGEQKILSQFFFKILQFWTSTKLIIKNTFTQNKVVQYPKNIIFKIYYYYFDIKWL
jgi:hypothetical protein